MQLSRKKGQLPVNFVVTANEVPTFVGACDLHNSGNKIPKGMLHAWIMVTQLSYRILWLWSTKPMYQWPRISLHYWCSFGLSIHAYKSIFRVGVGIIIQRAFHSSGTMFFTLFITRVDSTSTQTGTKTFLTPFGLYLLYYEVSSWIIFRDPKLSLDLFIWFF